MDLFTFFAGKKTKLKKRAEMLLPHIKLTCIQTYIPLLDRFPSFKSVPTKDWDFFFPIACVFSSTIGLLNADLSVKLKDELSEIFGNQLNQWSTDWYRAHQDCIEFCGKTIETIKPSDDSSDKKNFILSISDSIGSWLVWNLFGHSPESEEERAIVRFLGLLVTEPYINWWNKV